MVGGDRSMGTRGPRKLVSFVCRWSMYLSGPTSLVKGGWGWVGG